MTISVSGVEWFPGPMVRRLTTNQEIVGSSPAEITLFFGLMLHAYLIKLILLRNRQRNRIHQISYNEQL